MHGSHSLLSSMSIYAFTLPVGISAFSPAVTRHNKNNLIQTASNQWSSAVMTSCHHHAPCLSLLHPAVSQSMGRMALYLSHRADSDNGYDFEKKVTTLLHCAQLEAKPEPFGPEHLLITLLDNLDLSVLKKVGVTADAVRQALGLLEGGSAMNISVTDPVSFEYLDPSGLAFTDEMHEIFQSIIVNEQTATITKDDLVHALLEHLSHDPTGRLQSLLGDIIHNHDPFSEALDRKIEGFLSGVHSEGFAKYHDADDEQDLVGLTNDSDVESSEQESGHDALMAGPPRDLEAEQAVAQWRAAQSHRSKTTILDKLGQDLTERAANNQLSDVYGRDKAMQALSLALHSWQKGSAIVVGPPGCGKTALVKGLAIRIVEGKMPSLQGYRLIQVSVGGMVAGTQFRGMLEKNIQEIIQESRDKKVILFIDEIHGVIGTGRTTEGTADIGNLIKDAEGVKWIGATTDKEYTQIFKKDAALDRRFERITLSEPDRDTRQIILAGIQPQLEAFHGVVYTEAALQAVINLCDRYVGGYSPDKEITVLDRAGAWMNVVGKHSSVDAVQVTMIVEQKTGIPLTNRVGEQSNQASGVEMISRIKDRLRQYVIGQDKAVDVVAKAIFQSRIGVNADRPVVAAFAGPTGTGKTELAKAVATVDGRKMIEINLETVQQMSSLKGAEPGLVGFGEEGQLTGPQKLNPYSVILFDEMDKASDAVIKGLLGLLDNGYLYDSTGEKVSFKNAMIIFTTNFGATYEASKGRFGLDLPTPTLTGSVPIQHGHSQESLDGQNRAKEIKKALGDKMGPEVVGRMNHFVVFELLTPKELIAISELALRRIALEIKNSKNIDVYFSSHLIKAIAYTGNEPLAGARAIRTLCDELVRGALGHAIAEWPEVSHFERFSVVMFQLANRDQLELEYNGKQLIVDIDTFR